MAGLLWPFTVSRMGAWGGQRNPAIAGFMMFKCVFYNYNQLIIAFAATLRNPGLTAAPAAALWFPTLIPL